LLRDIGCEEVQGYYFRMPLPAVDFERLLAH
jgi:EAL domain-containing protein (putative c-di-GMP-specific phosphodiesterase class I)